MAEYELNITNLKNAVTSLEKALNVTTQKMREAGSSKDEIETLRAGVIQNFEFTYELSWKFMRRWLVSNYGDEYVAGDVFETARKFLPAAQDLVSRLEKRV